jgi:opacity protein-like surface antigen
MNQPLGRGKQGEPYVKHLLITGLAAATTLASLTASAERPFTAEHPQVGVRLGYGIYAGEEIGDFNPYGLGVGLTTGYTFDHLYLGISGEYYLGGWTESLRDESTGNIWSAMAEPGYDIILGKQFMLRPQVGVGVSSVRFEACVSTEIDGVPVTECEDETEFKLAVAPGAMFFIDDLGGFYGQVGARYHYIFWEKPSGGSANIGGILINVGVGAAW